MRDPTAGIGTDAKVVGRFGPTSGNQDPARPYTQTAPSPRRTTLNLRFLGLVMLTAFLLESTVAGQDFPDDHFFSGADRPAGLKSLEGKPAPKLSLDAWIGDETSLEDLRGNVIVVDFWATWCGPCMAAIPKNVALVEKYGSEGLAFIGVHDSNSGWDTADAVVNEKKINYPVARDAGGASVKAYNLAFWPTYVVIDRKGVVRAAGLLPDKVGAVVEKLLAEPGGPSRGSGGNSEFPVDWFVGGDQRLPAMAKLEGQPAPAIQSEEWIGAPLDADAKAGRVMVIRFVSPLSRTTRESMSKWRDMSAELGPQGVVFLGVCDHLADWQRMEALMGDQAPPFPIARDRPPSKGRLPLGVMAAEYGVRMWPTNVVVDRAGRVRAAGIEEARIPEVVGRLMAEPMTALPSDSPDSSDF